MNKIKVRILPRWEVFFVIQRDDTKEYFTLDDWRQVKWVAKLPFLFDDREKAEGKVNYHTNEVGDWELIVD